MILTHKHDEAGVSTAESETILTDVRVLAIDQTFRQDEENGQVVVAKRTATLELDPRQAEVVEMAETAGQLSLVLRSIAENDGKPLSDVGPRLGEIRQQFVGRRSYHRQIRPRQALQQSSIGSGEHVAPFTE